VNAGGSAWRSIYDEDFHRPVDRAWPNKPNATLIIACTDGRRVALPSRRYAETAGGSAAGSARRRGRQGKVILLTSGTPKSQEGANPCFSRVDGATVVTRRNSTPRRPWNHRRHRATGLCVVPVMFTGSCNYPPRCATNTGRSLRFPGVRSAPPPRRHQVPWIIRRSIYNNYNATEAA